MEERSTWADRADFESWWLANVVAFNRLSVADPKKWQRQASAVEAFQQKNRKG